MAEVIGDAGVLVAPLDPQDIARGILTAVGRAREGLAQAARERSLQFTWERAAELHVRAYRDAVAGEDA